jgi:hypothetical protein
MDNCRTGRLGTWVKSEAEKGKKQEGIGFALFYVAILAGGVVLVVIVIRGLYSK